MKFFRETDVVIIGDNRNGKKLLADLCQKKIRCVLLEKKTFSNVEETDICMPQNKETIIYDCTVTGFVKENDDVTIINTTKGAVLTKAVVNAADTFTSVLEKICHLNF